MADKILEISKVSPAPAPGAQTDICLPLTFFDLYNLTQSPPEMIFFYETHHPDSVLPKLKHSLSLTLKNFRPLAGILTWPSSSPKPFIRYKEGDGVLFTVSVTDADFDHLTSKNKRECKLFRPLVPHIAGSGSIVPVSAFNVTLFPHKGFCIGVTVHHSVFDAKSMELFLMAWASNSNFGENKQGLTPELAPNFDRKLVRERYMYIEDLYIEALKKNGVGPNKFAFWVSEPPPDTVRGTFQLSGLDVKKLKELVRARLVKSEKGEFSQIPYISTFVVTYAYVIFCLVRAKGDMEMKRLRVEVPYNCRGRLEPPLSANYVGNCIGSFATYIDRDDLLGNDLIIVVINFIIEGIKDLEKGVLRGAEEWVANDFKAAADKEAVKTYVAGSSKFKFQTIDFGWGKPRKADETLIDRTGGVSFSDYNGGGIEIELSLISFELERFASFFAQGLAQLVKNRSAAL